MIDFGPVRRREATIAELAGDVSPRDLVFLTNQMVDVQLAALEGSTDEYLGFVPVDQEAHDSYAATEAEVDEAWTLGHVIAHSTASSEEAYAQALSLARGLPAEGRSRVEVGWRQVGTLLAAVRRLEESRTMRLGMLQAWPSCPNLELTYSISSHWPPMNAVARVLTGLYHEESHLGQIASVRRQAEVAVRERASETGS